MTPGNRRNDNLQTHLEDLQSIVADTIGALDCAIMYYSADRFENVHTRVCLTELREYLTHRLQGSDKEQSC